MSSLEFPSVTHNDKQLLLKQGCFNEKNYFCYNFSMTFSGLFLCYITVVDNNLVQRPGCLILDDMTGWVPVSQSRHWETFVMAHVQLTGEFYVDRWPLHWMDYLLTALQIFIIFISSVSNVIKHWIYCTVKMETVGIDELERNTLYLKNFVYCSHARPSTASNKAMSCMRYQWP